MHFWGEGKTFTQTRNSSMLFYPMHFWGEGKTSSWKLN